MTHRIIIIGAGMGGLSSSVSLAGQPATDVLVLDAGARPGGKVGYAEHDGVAFDTGPSLLTLTEIPRALFASKGLALEDHLELVESTPNYRYYFPDGTDLDVFNDLDATATSIETTLGTKARAEFDAFMNYARRIWTAAAPNFIMGPSPNIGSMVRLGLGAFKQLRDIDPMRSMTQAIDARIGDERLKSVFLRYATYNGSDPRKAPATLACIAWVELGMGCWGIEGGMRELAKTMARIAADHGARFQFDTLVEGVRQRPQGGFLVQTATQEFIADSVVVNADVAHLVADLLNSEVNPGIEISSARSMSAFNLVIKARRRPARQRPGHAVVFPDRDYIAEFVDIFDHRRPPLQPTIYLCAQEKAHASPGWAAHEALFVMANAPAIIGGNAETFDWASYEAHILERLRGLSLIDADDEVIWRRRPVDLANQFPGSGGSLYGAASNSTFDAFRRPPNRLVQLQGLYLAGGTAHPGGGVPLCIQSGRQAAAELLETLRR